MIDTRIRYYNALLSPHYIQEEFPSSQKSIDTAIKARDEIVDILSDKSDKMFVVVGPCSIHDLLAAREYAALLLSVKERFKDDLVIIMRTYFEKPRTSVGWKGMVNDPNLDMSFDINKGLRMGRALMTEITHMGMPVSTELLDTISPQYTSDLISWGAIGARTTESQIHRELASGCSFPVGFKNGTDGNLSIIYDGIRAASSPHHFLGINKEGNACIMHTMGNSDCHVILRGGSSGPNYDAKHVQEVKNQLEKQNLNTISIMIDCSHGNSCGNYKNQSKVVESVADQVSHGEYAIKSVMIESNLKEGKQTMPEDGPIGLEYGISITDSCIGWEETEHLLETLAKAVQARRRQ